MKVLILGAGAREHAFAWKIAQSPLCEGLYVAPGNPGTAEVAENIELNPRDADAVIACVKEKQIGFVVVGPDELLAGGLIDRLRAEGIECFGPTKAAAEIEWSKAYAKDLMEFAGIPSAESKTFSAYEPACEYLREIGAPAVVKASGLALGKGVVIAKTLEEGEAALRAMLIDNAYGEAAREVVIEGFLDGVEFSAHALCAGTSAVLFPPSADHKRIGEGDTGANTGGMGTIAPVLLPDGVMDEVREKIVLPALRELSERGRPYTGLLFPGVMLTADGPKALEFNARFGDPETESYVRLMKSDLLRLMLATARGTLRGAEIEWHEGAAASVMLVSDGYPGAYEKGKEIRGLEDAAGGEDIQIFQGGTTKGPRGKLLTSGGRVMAVTALGDNLEDALAKAYRAAEKVSFDGMRYRRDIGAKWGILR